MKNTLSRVTTVYSRGRKFYICYDAEGKTVCGEKKHYWGIDSKLFGEDGHLTKEINGCAGHLSSTVSECVEQVRQTIEIDYIRETRGCTAMEAIEIFWEQEFGIKVNV